MKVHKGRRGEAPLIPNFRTTRVQLHSLAPRMIYFLQKKKSALEIGAVYVSELFQTVWRRENSLTHNEDSSNIHNQPDATIKSFIDNFNQLNMLMGDNFAHPQGY